MPMAMAKDDGGDEDRGSNEGVGFEEHNEKKKNFSCPLRATFWKLMPLTSQKESLTKNVSQFFFVVGKQTRSSVHSI